MNSLERDYKDIVTDRMRIGILVNMLPRDLQEAVVQQFDNKQVCKTVKDRVVMVSDTRRRLRADGGPVPMEVGQRTNRSPDEEEAGYVGGDEALDVRAFGTG